MEKSILDFTDNNKQATTIQNAIRGKLARNNIKNKGASKIQAAIRRRQTQQQFKAARMINSAVQNKLLQQETVRGQIKRFQIEISDLDKPAARAATTQRRNERRPIVEAGLNVIQKYQNKKHLSYIYI